MITHPTVLVLGAGASIPYGFPSGLQLMNTIITKLDSNSPNNFIKSLKEFSIADDEIRTFRDDLINSNALSVDAFLEYRPEFLNLGKLAITLALIPLEEEHKLSDFTNRGESWYANLFNKLNASFDAFSENKLSIITFNYDRSIEHCLFKSMRSKYKKSDGECAEKLSKLPMIHVHGRLGALPWQGEKGRAYSPRADLLKLEEIKNVSEQIVVIPEAEDTSSEFEAAFRSMKIANFIYFLGFGYHEMNLRRLKTDELKSSSIRGTGFRLGRTAISAIRGKWRIDIPDPDQEVLQFLKDWAPLI
ncbi:MAG TPA: hypothetical protein VGB01_01450 [candidate division Zixibacteria bacterium]